MLGLINPVCRPLFSLLGMLAERAIMFYVEFEMSMSRPLCRCYSDYHQV